MTLTFFEVSNLNVCQEVNDVHEELLAVPCDEKLCEESTHDGNTLLQVFLEREYAAQKITLSVQISALSVDTPEKLIV